MKIEFAAKVDIGKKESNDDRVLINGVILDSDSYMGSVETPATAVVCDGCGGYYGGYVAANTVLELLSQEDPYLLSDSSYLAEVLGRCQETVLEKKKEMPQFSEMCTTVAGCIFCDDRIVIFHSGDSRVYRHDKWGIARMTKDHSLVQELIDFGEITEEEAEEHPARNVIRRCIGVDSLPPDIYVCDTPVNPGEKYVICSDGLWEVVRDPKMKEILDSALSLEQMADCLVELAIRNGSDDNISICICHVPGEVNAAAEDEFILD